MGKDLMGILVKEPSGSLGKCASVKWPARGQNPCVEGERGAEGAGGGFGEMTDSEGGSEGGCAQGGVHKKFRGNERPRTTST